ncbi:MAG: exosortase system-associated protein, TIGR04073 family [Candidatus Omnitrophica bacterium]|nr:exosortase system-associated protein, TIGR04073 family [Candidatus Omnitrophota bacterium]
MRQRQGTAWVMVIAIAAGLGSHAAFAQETAQPSTSSDQVDQLMVRYNLHPAFVKLGRGVGNALMGWLEFPLNIQKYYAPSDAATTLFTGMGIGLVKSLVRTGVGLYETVTFFLPYPEEFAPILPTIDYLRRDGHRAQPLLLE